MGLFTDDFTVASDTPLENRTGWSLTSGTSSIECDANTDALEVRSGPLDCLYNCTAPGGTDYYIEVTLASLLNERYVAAAGRTQDVDNYIGLASYGTGASGLRLYKRVAGVVTDLITMQGVATSVYRVEFEGTTIRLYEDDVQQGSDQTVTDFSTETGVGIVLNTDSTLDLNLPIFSSWESDSLSSFQAAWANNSNQVIV